MIHDIHAREIFTHGFIGRFAGSWRHNLDVLFVKHPLVRIDFSGVTLADAGFFATAFAENCMARSKGENEYPGTTILKGMNGDTQHNLWAALFACVGLNTEVRNCCVLMERDNGLLYLFGKAEGTVKATFEDLCACLQLTASDLSSMNGIAINTASSRLKTLYDLGLCYREQRGQYFVYTFVGEGVKDS